MKPVTGVARARVGLLGNPSDGYGGQAIAIAIANFEASVTLRPAARFSLSVPDDLADHASLLAMVDSVERHGCDDGLRLLRAAIRRFAVHWPELRALPAEDPRLRFELRCATAIPRQVGLSGSSAIIIAALRSLATWFEVAIEPTKLAELALAAEVQDLGIAAGPMDRVIQAHEGVIHMDLAGDWAAHTYTRLDPARLPPLFVAWDPERGAPSGTVHGDLRTRWRRGDRDVMAAIATLRGLVDEGLGCLERRDVAGLCKLVDANFEVRASLCDIHERDRELVRIGREAGAAVKFCGSGGSVVGVMREEAELEAIGRAYERAGYPAEPVRVALAGGG